MRKIKVAVIPVALVFLCVTIAHLFYLYSLAPDETYPADTYLQEETRKKALIVVAHDDDASMFAGTTSMLANQGWELSFICFYSDQYRPEEVPVRKQEMEQVAGLLSLQGMRLVDFTLRNGLDTVALPWMPIPYADFSIKMDLVTLDSYVRKAIEEYQPTVILSLDNVIGGYGHPEHVAVSQSVVRICRENRNDPDFPVRRIYQNVWPASQSASVMGEGGTYAIGKKIYECDGMPVPDVEIDVSQSGAKKMAILKAHASQHRNLKKFVPYYHLYPHWVYFRIFDKEHFRVLEVQNL